MPFKVRALVFVNVVPLRSSTAPAATVIAPAEAPKAVTLPAFNAPSSISVPPVYVFRPDIVQVPAPTLVNEPVEIPTIDVIEPPCAPPKVRSYVPVIVPAFDKAIVPVSPTIKVSSANVTKPPNVAAVEELLIKAPPEPIPSPEIVKASALLTF